jgi:rhodanese-related sulfurtransferase
MQKKLRNYAAIIILLTSLIVVFPLLGACDKEEPVLVTEPSATTTIPSITSEPVGFDAVYEAVSRYLKSGSSWNIKAEDLFLLLNDDDEDNDPFIISVRKAEDYAKGHIPGAVNIPFSDIAKNGTLNALPRDRKIVVYCYTGHTGSQATAILGSLGFDAVNLLHGMSSWTKDTEVAPSRFTPESRKDYAYETEVNEASGSYAYPVVDKSVRGAAQAYTSPKNITSDDLFMLINDDDTGNDPFIVSLRSADDYAKGHIPGAVNIGFTALADKDTLAKLPSDRSIVVYCYTGHTGSQATALLNLLGYDATNLKFGMCSWTQDTEVAPKCFDNETASKDYEFELTPHVFVPVEEPTATTEEPVPTEILVMEGDTCVSCHSSEVLLKKVASPEEVTQSEETSGEG